LLICHTIHLFFSSIYKFYAINFIHYTVFEINYNRWSIISAWKDQLNKTNTVSVEEKTMPEITVVVTNEVGLHARPASAFVQTANKFSSDISVEYGERVGNAKSILTILTMGVNQNAEIKIVAEGEDAEEALAALEALVKNDFEKVA
jgi:phosphocarrier protein